MQFLQDTQNEGAGARGQSGDDLLGRVMMATTTYVKSLALS